MIEFESWKQAIAISSRQAAEICGVHPSTVKRWCDSGELVCRLTPGGHRRIPLVDLVAFADARGIDTPLRSFGQQAGAVWRAVELAVEHGELQHVVDLWFDWLLGDTQDDALSGPSSPRALQLSMGLMLQRGVSPALLFDEGVAGLSRRIGDAWHAGRIRTGDEHRATERIMDALHGLRLDASFSSAQTAGAGTAIVGAAEGNHHHLPAFLIRLILESRGWEVLYLGANVPGDDFNAQQQRSDARLVCASFTPPQTGADAQRLVRSMAQSYSEDRPYYLALGGAALDDQEIDFPYVPFEECNVFGSLREFDRWLDERPALSSELTDPQAERTER